MLRKVGLSLLCFTSLLCGNTFAAEINTLQARSVSMEFDLPPNEPQNFTNYMFWSIEANCRMVLQDSNDVLYIVAQAKKGK